MSDNSDIKVYRLTGRRSNGAEKDGGRLWHAVVGWRALCGREPGRLSDWSEYPGERVTCPKCISAIEKRAINQAKKDENGAW